MEDLHLALVRAKGNGEMIDILTSWLDEGMTREELVPFLKAIATTPDVEHRVLTILDALIVQRQTPA